MPSVLFLALGALFFWGVYRLSKVGHRPKDLPPGPPTVPILGNLAQIPPKDPHVQLTKWAQEYGPIYSLILGTKVMIVLSDGQVYRDLIDKRSAIYSDRPDMYIGQTLGSGGMRMLMMRYGPTWRMARKVVQGLLNINVSKSYVPYQDLENKQMLRDMLDAPDNFREHVRRYASSLTGSMVYGWRWATFHDAGLQEFFDMFDQFIDLNLSLGTALVDYFPVLRNIPSFLSTTQRHARRFHAAEKKLYLSFWLPAKQAGEKNNGRHCFCTDMQKLQRQEGISDDLAAYISSTIFEAGSDTTSSTLYGFIQAMVLYPDAQRKAQEELDAVVGADRMPTIEQDMHRLPYIRSCVKESLRWMPTAILGAAPHAVTQDDEYLGYRIPKGAAVMANVWAIHRDASRYPEPERFMPERYLGDETSLADSATGAGLRDQYSFGGGRRVCQGMHVAERSLFLGIARILWGFSIRPKKDGSGRDILPKQDVFTNGFVVMPVKFEAGITPRSEKRAEMMRRAWKDAEREFLDGETKQWK